MTKLLDIPIIELKKSVSHKKPVIISGDKLSPDLRALVENSSDQNKIVKVINLLILASWLPFIICKIRANCFRLKSRIIMDIEITF